MRQKSYDNTPTVYVIPTPIGNMDDITFRALNILKEVDIVFCEDTRVTAQLLNHFNIHKKLISNHKYNEYEIKEKILEELKDNHNVAVVSDRGMPGISDPGYIGANYAIENNYNVVCLPGACAFLPALMMSGITPQPFIFYGFLNAKTTKRIEELEQLKQKKETAIIYEAPHRLKNTLTDILKVYGNINISIAREISKIHEEIIRDSVGNIIDVADTLKGEFVIVLPKVEDTENYDNIDIKTQVDKIISQGKNKNDAIKEVAKLRNIKKSEVYNEYHRK